MANSLSWIRADSPFPFPDIAWWKLNDGSGVLATDSTGNGNTVTFISSPSWITGPNGNGAIDTMGTVYGSTPSPFSVASAFSITFWMNPASIGTIICTNGSFTDNGYDIETVLGTSQIKLRAINNVPAQVSVISNSSVVSIGTWCNVAITRNGSVGKIYVNALDVTQSSQDISNLKTPTNTFYLGAGVEFGTPLSFYDGQLDDFRIYGSELSQSDVTSIYNAGAQ